MRILPAEMWTLSLFLGVTGISTGISPGPPSDVSEDRLSVSHSWGCKVTRFLWEAETLCEWSSLCVWHSWAPQEFGTWMKNQECVLDCILQNWPRQYFFQDLTTPHQKWIYFGDFPGGTVVKNLPANAGDMVQALVWEIPHAVEQLSP